MVNEAGISLRPVRLDDARLLFEWANDPLVRAMAFSTAPIIWEDHLIWLQKNLSNANCHMAIASAQGRPVGQIRFDVRDGRTAEVDVHIASAERGRGFGPMIIRAGAYDLLARTDVQQIVAIAKSENRGSIAAFMKAGFEKFGSIAVHGIACERLIFQRGSNWQESCS